MGLTPSGVRSRRRLRGMATGVYGVRHIAWPAVDWSQSNSAIARTLDVAISTVRRARIRHTDIKSSGQAGRPCMEK